MMRETATVSIGPHGVETKHGDEAGADSGAADPASHDLAPLDAYGIGERYEASLGERERRLGAHFTPADVAEALVERVWEVAGIAADAGAEAPVVCDPSCGGGVFLVAAANRLAADGYGAEDIVERYLLGVDLDPGAVAATTAALRQWAIAHGAKREVTPRVLCGDGLDASLVESASVDLVIGNPPFQNQLGTATARDGAQREAAAARFGLAAKGYVDLAALFILRALEMVRPGGVVCLIQPRSLLAARDAAPVRFAVLARHRLDAMWLPGSKIFAAAVDVCAPIITAGSAEGTSPANDALGHTRVLGGRHGTVDVAAVATDRLVDGATWSPLWAAALGVPHVELGIGDAGDCDASHNVGDIAAATAGFRDQFYGVLPYLCSERPANGARVVTSGMIDPLELSWATRPSKIGGHTWTAPWVDLDELGTHDPDLYAWISKLLVPKVLVATQTKVIEVVIDLDGDIVPLTPVIAVVPHDAADVTRVAAALAVPAATAWAAARFGGGGMSHGALKLAAKQILQIPLPSDDAVWRRAGDFVSTAAQHDGATWKRLGAALNASWRIDDPTLVEWWVTRLPQMSSRRKNVR